MSDVSECVVKQREREVAVSVEGDRDRSWARNRESVTPYIMFYNIFSQKQSDECSSPIVYILESESKYESSIRESKSSHKSREWILESDSSPKNSDSSRTRVRVQDSSTPSLVLVATCKEREETYT